MILGVVTTSRADIQHLIFLHVLGSTLWSKGSNEGWYYRSKSNGLTWKKWWARSLLAHIGLELFLYLVIYFIIHAIHQLVLGEDERDEFERVSRYQAVTI